MARTATPKPPKKPRGRPSVYTPEVADEIVSRLSLGETLTSIGNDPNMPSRVTIWEWEERLGPNATEHQRGFSVRLRAARLKQADSEFDQLKDLADQPLTVARTREELERRKMQIDVRKFRTARLNRQLYGESKDVKLTGDASNPVSVQSKANVNALSTEEQEQLRELARKMLQGSE